MSRVVTKIGCVRGRVTTPYLVTVLRGVLTTQTPIFVATQRDAGHLSASCVARKSMMRKASYPPRSLPANKTPRVAATGHSVRDSKQKSPGISRARALTFSGVLVEYPSDGGKDAAVAELADAQASGACVLRDVEVRLLSAAFDGRKPGMASGFCFAQKGKIAHVSTIVISRSNMNGVDFHFACALGAG